MVICISFIIDYISAALGGAYYIRNREDAFVIVTKNFNEFQTRKWTYQHLIIILRYENSLVLIPFFKQIEISQFFDKTIFILKHNYRFKLGHLKQ